MAAGTSANTPRIATVTGQGTGPLPNGTTTTARATAEASASSEIWRRSTPPAGERGHRTTTAATPTAKPTSTNGSATPAIATRTGRVPGIPSGLSAIG